MKEWSVKCSYLPDQYKVFLLPEPQPGQLQTIEQYVLGVRSLDL
jgi:hypothetical protein